MSRIGFSQQLALEFTSLRMCLFSGQLPQLSSSDLYLPFLQAAVMEFYIRNLTNFDEDRQTQKQTRWNLSRRFNLYNLYL